MLQAAEQEKLHARMAKAEPAKPRRNMAVIDSDSSSEEEEEEEPSEESQGPAGALQKVPSNAAGAAEAGTSMHLHII